MNAAITLTPTWLRPAVFTLGWLVVQFNLSAQTPATGIVQGRVFNPVSGDFVRNAEVRVEGTNEVAFTENDGSFRFVGVPAGTATVTVNFTGYVTARETFNVVAGQTATKEINLTSTA